MRKYSSAYQYDLLLASTQSLPNRILNDIIDKDRKDSIRKFHKNNSSSSTTNNKLFIINNY